MPILPLGSGRSGGQGSSRLPLGSPGSGGLGMGQTSSSSASIEALERAGRRMQLLRQYAPELVNSSPEGAISMAESPTDDNELLRSAMETENFSALTQLRERLEEEDSEVQRATWQSLPEGITEALNGMGYKLPEKKDKGRLFGSIPVLGDITEAALDWGSIPGIGGALEEAQHFAGEGAEALGDVTETAMTPFSWFTDQLTHTYRSLKVAEQEGGTAGVFSPSALGRAWGKTDEDDMYVRPQHLARARRKIGNDQQLMRMARGLAAGQNPDEIIESFGYEPDSPEALQLGMMFVQAQADPEFQDAVHEMSIGQVSLGRTVAQSFGFDDTDAGWGRILSGTIDGGFNLVDPLFFASGPIKAARFGRNAYRLEEGGDGLRRLTRILEIAENMGDDATPERVAGAIESINSAVGPGDMRRARGVRNWAGRVAQGFQTGELSRLSRELPSVQTAMGSMVHSDIARRATGEAGLDTTEGVLQWLRSSAGIKTLTSTRLGGGSPIRSGVMLPTLTATQRRMLQGRKVFQEAIDLGRVQYAPKITEMLREVGSPRNLRRQVGRFLVGHSAGDVSRLVAAISAHTPYEDFLPLYGNRAVEEFQRYTNAGIFAGLDRATLDSLTDGFIKGGLVERTNMVHQLNERLFDALGVNATEEGRRFADKFLSRARQAYSTDPGDANRYSRLVDAQHADNMSIPKIWSPNMREPGLLNMARRTNLVKFFNNIPATHVNALLGRVWKPAVLMRIGFIPRAAGEELLRFVMAHGGRTYLGAKGAEWQVRDTLDANLRAQLNEAESLGQVDQVNRIKQRLAETNAGVLAPLRSLAAGADRGWTRVWASQKRDVGRWGRYWTNKAEARIPVEEGGRGVVSGLERWADETSLWASGVMHEIAQRAHMPTKSEIGGLMARRWNPNAAEAARLMIEDPTIQAAFAEHVAGSTMVPWETRRMTDIDGAPVPRVQIMGTSGGTPALLDVEMRPLRDEWKVFTQNSVSQDITGYFNSVYTRHRRLRHDRVGSAVMEGVLPRWVGDWGSDVAGRLGYDDVARLRGDLNQLWEDDELLGIARRIVDRDDEVGEGLKVTFGQRVDEVAAERGLAVDGRKLRESLEANDVHGAAQRWMIYQNVDADRLINNWGDLEHAIITRSRGRLSRPDVQPHLREMRLYAEGERLAQPVQDGISKVYVPLVNTDPGMVDEAFIAAVTRRITLIGGYAPEVAESIARRVAGGLDDAREASEWTPGAMRALSAWGSSDPRVAEAVMGAADEVLGTSSTFGILGVPDEVVQRAASDTPLGVRTEAERWEIADDYNIDPYHLPHVKPTPQRRRFVELKVGKGKGAEWWDDVELAQTTAAFQNPRVGTTRMYSTDRETWSAARPDDGPFWFVDAPPDVGPMTDDLAQDLGAKRLPGFPRDDGTWPVRRREVGEGLGEIEAMERVAEGSMDEILETLTTLKRQDVDNDVLHEIIEPMMRPDRKWVDAAGNEQVELGYGFDHLVMNADWNRLPRETYGQVLVAAPDLKWDRFVREWFDGPVNQALASVIRKPMFLHNFGEQLAQQRGLLGLFSDPERAGAVRALGFDDSELDHLALGLRHGDGDEDIANVIAGINDNLLDRLSNDDFRTIRGWARQHNHGLDTVRGNALNRAIELTTPYIDDHRIRSAFQNYINNMVPFQFAEEQFLKRWVRTVWESPEVIRKMQLAMNGARNMGVIRKDERGQDVFVYPLVGEAVAAMSHLVAPIFGDNLRIPYVASMTGAVGYTLPGLGERMGHPSVGPLVAMPLELLSRHFPELADLEAAVSGPGADRPVWNYFAPSWAGRAWEGMFGDMDKGQLASATLQAMQMMAVNGQAPPENATPDQMEEFIDRAQGQARTVLLARSLLGMVGPAAPQWQTEADQLNARFVELLRTAGDTDTAISALLAENPDMEPADLLSATAFTTESEYAGLGTPTDETFDWINENASIVDGFPAAAPWLLPRAGAEDQFSYRAWAQQVAKGLRRRKAPEEFLEDMYFQKAARDYFEMRELHEADMLTATGPDRQDLEAQWRERKGAYFAMHPVFARALEDPSRSQRRRDAIDQLNILSADPDGPVPSELREMLGRYREYSSTVEALRGNRTRAVTEHRQDLTTELVTWSSWWLNKHPHLRGFWMRIIEPELAFIDEDAAATLATL